MKPRQAGLEETSQQSQVENADMENEKVTVFEQKSSKAEIIERLKELSRDIDNINKAELDFLKQNFYKLHKAEIEAAKKTFIENGVLSFLNLTRKKKFIKRS